MTYQFISRKLKFQALFLINKLYGKYIDLFQTFV